MNLWVFFKDWLLDPMQEKSPPLASSFRPPRHSPAPLSRGWGQDGGAIRQAGTTGLDDRHQKPSLNKGWVGGGLVCPHPHSLCLLSQDYSQQGGESMARAVAVLLSLILQLASRTLAPGTSRGKLGC